MRYFQTLLIPLILLVNSCGSEKQEFHITAENPLNIERNDEILAINIEEVKETYPGFDINSFVVYSGEEEIPSQIIDLNNDNNPDKIIFLANFNPSESKSFTIKNAPEVQRKDYKKRTAAYLGEKTDYNLEDGYYKDGKFVSVDSAKIPEGHFAHNALYQFEGPGWESELVAYRFYLDSRNRNDIFGKKVDELILPEIGKNDLVSDSKESYTQMHDWGMDIFKVGESLGIGSIAMWHNEKPVTVSDVDNVACYIRNGPIRSGVYTNYFNWKVGDENYDLSSDLSITAGSRLTKTVLNINGNNPVMCTGFAKHENCEFITSENSDLNWGYIALYGPQTVSGDDLGIAVFYKKSDLVKNTENEDSHIVALNPEDGKLVYYFAAAWQQEKNGINTKDEFVSYLNKTINELSNPVLTIL